MSLSDFDPSTTAFLVDGEPFDLAHPEDQEVSLHNVAHALSNISRYTGHTAERYSVAEHAVHVAMIVKEIYEQPDLALAALHHDSHEVFTNDISTPMKQLMKAGGFDFRAFERGFKVTISKSFGIPLDDFGAAVIKDADALVYAAECGVLKRAGHGPLPDIDPEMLAKVMSVIGCWDPPTAEFVFMTLHKRLSESPEDELQAFIDAEHQEPEA